jgi:antitoxin HigA-1
MEMAPRMKNPPHPGGLIKDDNEALGLSVAEAAEGLGVTRQQLYRVVRGENGVSPEMAMRLEKAFGGAADFWLRMQMSFDLARGRAQAGNIKVKPQEPKVA